MATTKDYKSFVLEQLSILDNIVCRPMMGEYLLYYNNILFGGIYDNQVLVKIVESNEKYHMKEVIPYKNAKPMYWIENLEQMDTLKDIIVDTCMSLSPKNKS